MTLVDTVLFVATADAILQFPYRTGMIGITDTGRILTRLPGGPINHHWTKSLLASVDGKRLYVGVGSNSKAGENGLENGLENETDRASIWAVTVYPIASRPCTTAASMDGRTATTGRISTRG